MKELTHKEVSAKGGKNRGINMRNKLGVKGFSDYMRKVSEKRKSLKDNFGEGKKEGYVEPQEKISPVSFQESEKVVDKKIA